MEESAPLISSPMPSSAAPGISVADSVLCKGDSEARSGGRQIRSMTLYPLVALLFFDVAGGPFGTEGLIRSAGPAPVLVGLIVVALLWALPCGLASAELGSAFPHNAGVTLWVGSAFGPSWGFMVGWLSWVGGVADNALYPAMAAAYFSGLGITFKFFFVVALSLLCIYGLRIIGRTALVCGAIVISPFVVLAIVALGYGDATVWTESSHTLDWSLFVNLLLWNLNGIDGIAALSGEVVSPGRTLPRAVILTIVFAAASYVVPLMAVTALDSNWSLYHNGYFATVATAAGGKLLKRALDVAALASCVGQYIAEMTEDAYQLAGMADEGLAPRILGTRSDRYGTPWVSMLLATGIILIMCVSPFGMILQATNAFYAMQLGLELAAMLKLRYTHPDLHRPYRVPLENTGVALMLLGPAVFCGVTMLMCSMKVLVTTSLVSLSGYFFWLAHCQFAGGVPNLQSRWLTSTDKSTDNSTKS